MLKNELRAVVCAHAAAARSFLQIALFTSRVRIRKARFHCGHVKDVVMKKLASGASLPAKRSTEIIADFRLPIADLKDLPKTQVKIGNRQLAIGNH
jgi:hypothetical protein